jgi:hypothetical protein
MAPSSFAEATTASLVTGFAFAVAPLRAASPW